MFLVSFGFWLGQPQAEKPYSQIPDVSWVFVTTTVPAPIDTLPPVVETTLPPETTIAVDTVPTETTLDPAGELLWEKKKFIGNKPLIKNGFRYIRSKDYFYLFEKLYLDNNCDPYYYTIKK